MKREEYKGNRFCALCGGEVKDVILEMLEQQLPGGEIAFFENVPAQECQKCGEQWFSSKVIRLLNNASKEKYAPVRKLEVPVYHLELGELVAAA
ncbi:MAG: YgiT-type zinc finger protein [bacterium]|nr:YgiT-type zinc finger protein [bacterium]